MKRRLLLPALILIIALGIVIGRFNDKNEPTEKIGYALDTQIRIVVYDKDVKKELLDNAYNEILRLDKKLSNFDRESETASLNTKKSLQVSDELKAVISEGISATEETNGSYDITVYPLSSLWNYKNKKVPDKESVLKALQKINVNNISISGNEITLKNDAQIDVSSIAKGYIADFIIDYLKANKVKNALVDAGGNIKIMGTPDSKKEYFNIGVKNPDVNDGMSMGTVKLTDCSIVTSGIYERFFEDEGVIYHHIIDTKTGYPAQSDLLSASVISKSSVRADAYATAIIVMGSQKGMELIEKTEDTECILITKDKRVLVSGGIDDFKITNDAYKF